MLLFLGLHLSIKIRVKSVGYGCSVRIKRKRVGKVSRKNQKDILIFRIKVWITPKVNLPKKHWWYYNDILWYLRLKTSLVTKIEMGILGYPQFPVSWWHCSMTFNLLNICITWKFICFLFTPFFTRQKYMGFFQYNGTPFGIFII